MTPRLRYHFEPKTGWINDPNGLCYFQGKYHAFFQHYPYAPKWGPMHWGHAVSEDLLHWEELPIALVPTEPYEDSPNGGCFSGSAIVKGDTLYLFYTSVSTRFGQTQSVATSTDGIHFTKYAGNPVIPHFPHEGSEDFRDPKVSQFGDTYYMVCGSGKDGVGKVLLYASQDLLHWEYQGVLIQGERFGNIVECPDFFPMEGGAMLLFSKMNRVFHSTQFVWGKFQDGKFLPQKEWKREAGPDFYAPQTFLAPDGRRILIGWMYSWRRKVPQDATYAGALSLPRELKWEQGELVCTPIREAKALLTGEDPLVQRTPQGFTIDCNWETPIAYEGEINQLEILRDTASLEVFVNGGRENFSTWIDR